MSRAYELGFRYRRLFVVIEPSTWHSCTAIRRAATSSRGLMSLQLCFLGRGIPAGHADANSPSIYQARMVRCVFDHGQPIHSSFHLQHANAQIGRFSKQSSLSFCCLNYYNASSLPLLISPVFHSIVHVSSNVWSHLGKVDSLCGRAILSFLVPVFDMSAIQVQHVSVDLSRLSVLAIRPCLLLPPNVGTTRL